MGYMEGLEDLRGKELLVRLFRFVQAIPYRVSGLNEVGICREAVNTALKKGDSRHKNLLLYNLLMERNFDVDKAKVIFDWADLPVPADILGILEKSGTRMSADVLRMNENEHYAVYLDATWSPELEELGFPVTGDWDGVGPTAQITKGKLEYFETEGFRDEDHGIFLDKDEVARFGEALNAWLDKVAPIK